MDNNNIDEDGGDVNLADKFLHHDEKALCRFKPVEYLYHTGYIGHLKWKRLKKASPHIIGCNPKTATSVFVYHY